MIKPTESQIQRSIMHFLRTKLPKSYLAYHTPNGGNRNPVTAAKLKAEGVMPGVPDITIIGHGRVWFLEVKREGGALDPSQRWFSDWCGKAAIPFEVVRSIDDAQEVLTEWGVME